MRYNKVATLDLIKGENMYYVYIKQDTGYDAKKLVGEFEDIDEAYDKVDEEIAKNKDVKYIIEKTTGHVDIYGELISKVVEKN